MNRATRRKYTKSRKRRVTAFSELNRNLRPDQLARLIVAESLEQARREAEARAENEARAGNDTDSEEAEDA
ncbi:hypothetical protein [uncultured Microbacterium sp.]|uniref:hypothetical protein n=1 Tax=uncultured Microbacterium sp. TaxID=191216 RepID=UPI0028EFA934|nr:hypothetical protein [uncultured Microbacterium sp.]